MKCRLHTILSLASGLSYIWHRAYKKKQFSVVHHIQLKMAAVFRYFIVFKKNYFSNKHGHNECC